MPPPPPLPQHQDRWRPEVMRQQGRHPRILTLLAAAPAQPAAQATSPKDTAAALAGILTALEAGDFAALALCLRFALQRTTQGHSTSIHLPSWTGACSTKTSYASQNDAASRVLCRSSCSYLRAHVHKRQPDKHERRISS